MPTIMQELSNEVLRLSEPSQLQVMRQLEMLQLWHQRKCQALRYEEQYATTEKDHGRVICARAERVLLDEHLQSMLAALRFLCILESRPGTEWLPDNCRLRRLCAGSVNGKPAAAQQ